ncbi:MAG: uroporphyrinogen decarboxylase family protein [Planctomycetota bacterium]
MDFQPDWQMFEAAVRNRRPARLPLHEHIISPTVMERITGVRFADLRQGGAADLAEFFRQYCGFFRAMTYDVVSYEVCITEVLPGSGAISGGMAGPIQNGRDLAAYPWDRLPALFWEKAAPRFAALAAALPPGMRAAGGVGNGVFEIAEDLVGLEYLPFLEVDDPAAYAELFRRIGDLMHTIWGEFLKRHAVHFAACRFGDDLGFKTSLLTHPRTFHDHIAPQYKRIIDLVHAHGRPFLWHSCGCIFDLMNAAIGLGIDAKHSNEDAIAPFDTWIERYGGRIGLLGGFDMDFLCQSRPAEVRARVIERGTRYRAAAQGYALGSGNSIPDYVPAANYLAMVEGARVIREREGTA